MTDNGVPGMPPSVLGQMRGESLPPQGPFVPQAAPVQHRGFSAAALWDGVWDFRPEVDAWGEIPHPTQERIDTFRRKGAEFAVEAERLAREAEAAQRKLEKKREEARAKAQAEGKEYNEPFNAKKLLADVNEAIGEEHRLYNVMRDHVAEFCAGSPTREHLDGITDPTFRRFVDHIGSLINPEV